MGQCGFGGARVEACSPVAGVGDVELISPDTVALQLSSSMLERTLPFLDIQSRALEDEVIGTGHCLNCGGTPIQLEIAAITTQENIHFQTCTTEGNPKKRKISVI